jgi:hypothetical protein
MQTDPKKDAEESKQSQENNKYTPYDGFVNVNEIVERRRRLRNAEFNVADESWDADLNPLSAPDAEDGSE